MWHFNGPYESNTVDTEWHQSVGRFRSGHRCQPCSRKLAAPGQLNASLGTPLTQLIFTCLPLYDAELLFEVS